MAVPLISHNPNFRRGRQDSKPGDDDGGWVLLDDAAATPEAPGGLFDLTTTARLDLMLEDRSAVSWTSTWSQRNDNPDDGPEGCKCTDR